MNLLLLKQKETKVFLPSEDGRVKHIREILRMTLGSEFYVGVENGPLGKARIIDENVAGISLEIEWESETRKPFPITLIVGLPRPQIGRRILEECTSLGVARIFFFPTEKGENSYISSKLWQTNEWRQHLTKGAQQAFSTTVPEVVHFTSLLDCIEFLMKEGRQNVSFIGLDNYEALLSLKQSLQPEKLEHIIAIGAERGWSKNERTILRNNGFMLAHLGERVLKVDVACIVAVGSVIQNLFFC